VAVSNVARLLCFRTQTRLARLGHPRQARLGELDSFASKKSGNRMRAQRVRIAIASRLRKGAKSRDESSLDI
jgi:hypothetical protein